MQIERYERPDGSEELVRKLFPPSQDMKQRLAEEHKRAMTDEDIREVRQVMFDPDDPCPCGGPKKAKNCCASKIVRRMARQRAGANKAVARAMKAKVVV